MSLDYSYTTLTAEERVAEAYRLFKIISDHRYEDILSLYEIDFLQSMKNTDFCSPKQLGWLRRLKDKVVDQ